MSSAADDTLAELARIVGSGETLSDGGSGGSSLPPFKPVGTNENPPVSEQPVQLRPAPPVPVAPVEAAAPSMQMDDVPETGSDLPHWAKATEESVPKFDFDLQNRLQEAFGGPISEPENQSAIHRAVEVSQLAEVSVEEDITAAAEDVHQGATITPFPDRAVNQAEQMGADELDLVLNAELDRVLADEMAESQRGEEAAELIDPDVQARQDFEAELARMFLPDEIAQAPEPDVVEPDEFPEVAAPPAEVLTTHETAPFVPVGDPSVVAMNVAAPATHAFDPVQDAPLAAPMVAPAIGVAPAPVQHQSVAIDPASSTEPTNFPHYSEDMDEPESGRGKSVALALLCVALLGGAAAFAFNFSGSDTGPPPIIMAETGPVKAKPADPGGEAVPNQDQAVYKSVEGAGSAEKTQEALIESTEEPIKSTAAKPASNAKPNTLKPRMVRTVSVRPDGTIVGAAEVKAVASVGAEPKTAREALSTLVAKAPEAVETKALPIPTVAPKAEAAPKPAPKIEAPKVVAPKAEAPAAKPKPAPKAVKVAKVEPKPVAAKSSPYAVQISSQRSQDAAKSSYRTLSGRYGSIIGGKGVDIRRADIEGKGTYYRVRIPAQTRKEANSICSRLKSAGGSCFVTR